MDLAVKCYKTYENLLIKCYRIHEKFTYKVKSAYYRKFHAGTKYQCPFCQHSFGEFIPTGFKRAALQENKVVGAGYRKNDLCPYCNSGERTRLTYLFIKQHNLIKPSMKLFHVAPEIQLKKVFEESAIDYYSGDLSSPLAEIQMDIQNISFPDNYFDAIICNHVLEHIVNDIGAMKELFRVLKKGGWAILLVPYSPIRSETFEDSAIKKGPERRRLFGQSDHVRAYGRDYVQRL